MNVGIELVAARQLSVQLGSFVETSLLYGGKEIPRTKGQDEYHLSTRIPTGNRFAATGRKFICQLDLPGLGLGPMEARPAVNVPLPDWDEDFENLTILVKTNFVFQVHEFCRYVKVKLIINGISRLVDTSQCRSPRPGIFITEVSITKV